MKDYSTKPSDRSPAEQMLRARWAIIQRVWSAPAVDKLCHKLNYSTRELAAAIGWETGRMVAAMQRNRFPVSICNLLQFLSDAEDAKRSSTSAQNAQ